jgi:transcription-repair coupling factor (superfamily II helicase)
MAAELIDRFGPLPPEADQLLKVVGIKGLCRQAGIEKIDVGPKGVVVTFRGGAFANPLGLVQFVQQRASVWKLRPDSKAVMMGEFSSPVQRLAAAEKVAGQLAKVAAEPGKAAA